MRARLERFTRAERALHWATAILVLTAAITGMILYVPSLAAAVSRRETMKTIHVYSGLAMAVPLLVAYAGKWRRAVRADVRRLAGWTPGDVRWLKSFGRKATGEVGKFNAGQKANAAFIAGMIPVMMATGSVMRWFDPFPLSWRNGADTTHRWIAFATWIIVIGHILVAISKPPALLSMFRGWMPAAWARDHHPRWEAIPEEPAEIETPVA